jgi:mannan endo-1,4-beta-mannosidase
MRKQFAVLAAAILAVVASVLAIDHPAYAATGLHISGRNIVEADGQPFIMRGVSHEHVWFTGQTSSFANIKALHANTVRVVLGSGQRWGPSNDVADVISLCKQNRLICVLEVHDTTGYGEQSGAATLDQAADYWISHKSELAGQESYIVINIGNEPIGNNDPGQWTDATAAAVKKMRANGFQHLLMVDAPNWGQDWQNVMRDNAQTVEDADTLHNTVFSIHMYSVYNTASSITTYFDAFAAKGLPLVVGEFGWQFDSSQVDDQTVMSEAVSRGIGYLGWSWAGNSDPILDMTNNFDPTQLTTWGQRIFNGTNGIQATAKEAAVYGGGTTTPPSSPPPSSTSACTATYTVVNQWSGGFQGEVRVTAGSSAINGWTVNWTFPNGQSITQAWNATTTSTGSSVTAHSVSYNATLAAGAGTTFGFIGAWNGTNTAPSSVSCTTG